MRGLILRDRREAEVEALHHARPELLDDHIRLLNKRPQAVAIALILQVERRGSSCPGSAARTPPPRRRGAAASRACPRRPARSILITSAPASASIRVASGPGSSVVKSRTRTPESGWIMRHGDIALGLEPAHAGAERLERARDVVRPVHRRHQAARRAHDVDAVRQHRDAQPMAEVGVAHGLQLLEAVAQRIERLRIDVETLRVLENEERRRIAIDAPRHILLDQDLPHPGADVLRGGFGLVRKPPRARRSTSVATAAAAHSGFALNVP